MVPAARQEPSPLTAEMQRLNAACESFMKTLKYEDVLRSEYRNLAEARASIREFLEKVYNQKRLHSSLGYVPPAEFEPISGRVTAKTMKRRPLRGGILYEFLEASGNLSIRQNSISPGAAIAPPPASSSFR